MDKSIGPAVVTDAVKLCQTPRWIRAFSSTLLLRRALKPAGRRRRLLADAFPMALCVGILAAPTNAHSGPPPDSPNFDSAWFACTSSSTGNCADVLVRAIREADKTIMVEAADPGPRSVLHALCSDAGRGVDVEMVQDRDACEIPGGNDRSRLPRQCAPNYRIDSLQTMVIDRKVVVRAFFASPPAAAAPRPIDHLLIDMDPTAAAAYSDAWENRSRPLQAPVCRQPQ